MPEFMGFKITRAEESARHAYRRSLEKAVRAISKGSDWRSVEGCLFREKAGWFVSVSPSVHIFERKTYAIASVRPMAIDPIFWNVVGLPENQKMPLSFRCNGAWVCHPPYFSETAIQESEYVEIVATRLLEVADQSLKTILDGWSLEDFMLFCEERVAEGGNYLPCVVTALLALGREHEALMACDKAKSSGDDGGFLVPEGTFTDIAIAWINASIAGATRH